MENKTKTSGQLTCSDCLSKRLQLIYIARSGNEFVITTLCLDCGYLNKWNLNKDIVEDNITKDKEIKF